MSFFNDAGAWFEQAGKDIDQAAKDAGEWFHETQDTIVNEVIWGDAADAIINAQDDISHTLYNILHPNNPTASSVVDQIESTIVQPPTSDFDDPLTNPNSVAMDDILTGSSGKDIFILTEGEDLITDFNRGEGDKISLQNFSGVIGLRKVINTDDIEILVDGINVTTVQDVDGDFFFHTLFVDSEDNQFTYFDFVTVPVEYPLGP